jgi:hypothetical protein
MKTNNQNNQCCRKQEAKIGFWYRLKSRLTQQLNDHVALCPRCQQRLAAFHRVELALTLVNTQPLNAGLLAQANNKTLNILKHSLRFAPKSATLRTAKSDIGRLEKIRPGLERVLNVAACVFVILMIKTGVSDSLLDYKEQGEAVIHNYYARNLDSQLLNEIFPTNPSEIG